MQDLGINIHDRLLFKKGMKTMINTSTNIEAVSLPSNPISIEVKKQAVEDAKKDSVEKWVSEFA